jgi:hypothetical protein
MIDKDKIFQLFVDGKTINDEHTKEEIKGFMNGPYAKIGMFVKLIQNHHIFHQKLEKFLKRESPEYNVESTKDASEFAINNRAWSYIKKISLDNSEDIDAIQEFNPELLYGVLEGSIKYFESSEDYIKCAHLFAIQQTIEL